MEGQYTVCAPTELEGWEEGKGETRSKAVELGAVCVFIAVAVAGPGVGGVKGGVRERGNRGARGGGRTEGGVGGR
jgi:hypothetical protein